MKTGKLIIISLLLICSRLHAQTCASAPGDQVTYGTNDTWIGYVYDNDNFTRYFGYVTQGSPGNMNFDQSFGGDDVTYAVNGCNIRTENFSIRYKLRKTFAATSYTITIGGDDGYRISIDGGNSWLLQDWGGHGYTTRTGTYTLVVLMTWQSSTTILTRVTESALVFVAQPMTPLYMAPMACGAVMYMMNRISPTSKALCLKALPPIIAV